ncbi:hypothetical protein MCSF7_01726 [Mycoplasmopsis columbina SF7]|uniref:Uncharacterized protein n=1 Tax=Mycoplasmopsis columbina SF7 TaxID=1037410 RepID=F9UKD4_9BACT|nr:hypothetical protein [Mycoplasmopsis columbina]EGV00139.1 hypothetical protein MCSF7_01726 [Mycoplasmopsis columbina SF7]
MVFSGISSIANIVKMFGSKQGEIKSKDYSLKWDNNSSIPKEPKMIYLAY